jgi:hypothetical protein
MCCRSCMLQCKPTAVWLEVATRGGMPLGFSCGTGCPRVPLHVALSGQAPLFSCCQASLGVAGRLISMAAALLSTFFPECARSIFLLSIAFFIFQPNCATRIPQSWRLGTCKIDYGCAHDLPQIVDRRAAPADKASCFTLQAPVDAPVWQRQVLCLLVPEGMLRPMPFRDAAVVAIQECCPV